jgi:outer membrane lipoprotein-sorting protein
MWAFGGCLKYLVYVAVGLFSLVSSAQTADEIIAKSISARGGSEKIKAVQSQRLTGNISFGPDAEGVLIVEMKRPGKMREQFTLGGKTMIRTTNGTSGWSVNPFAGKDVPGPLSADEMRTMNQKADFDRPLVDYKGKGNQIELLGKERIEDKDAYKLKVTLKDGQLRYDYIDASTYQEIKWEGKIVADGREIEAVSYFKDYRDVNGVMYPFRIESETSSSAAKQTITFEKIEINPVLDDARFGNPEVAPAPDKQAQ